MSKKICDLCGIKESDTGLAPPCQFDLVSNRQTMQEEQPLQVARCTKIINPNTDASKYVINMKQIVKFLVGLGDKSLPTDIEEGMRVGVDLNKYQIQIPLLPKIDPSVTMMTVEEKSSDVGGCKEHTEKMREDVELPMLHPEKFVKLSIDLPKGALSYGPPGTRKTLLDRAVAKLIEACFIRVIGSHLVQKYVGEGGRMVHELFQMALSSIVFFDEVDAISGARFDDGVVGDNEVQRTTLEIVDQLDGFDARGNIKLLMATNRPDALDPTLLHPGRLDRKVAFSLPDLEGRTQISKIHTRTMNCECDIGFKLLARLCPNATGPNPSSSWSDLPTDIIFSILQRLQLPEAVAFPSVCTSWCSAATAAGIPRSCTPMLMSWRDLESRKVQKAKCSSALTLKFCHLLDVRKSYDVNFPQGLHFVTCCGSSHGWLILVNELSNLVLYNPFTLDTIALPPVTDFTCVEAVHDSEGNIEAYCFEKSKVNAKYMATWFYQKAVLSCSPRKGDEYSVMIIHANNWLSFVRAGESKWQVASTVVSKEENYYVDCVYHNGMFYTVTFRGTVEKWGLDALNGPVKEVIVDIKKSKCILTRHLVSTPWGDLLEVHAFRARCKSMYKDGVGFEIVKVGPNGYERVLPVSEIELMEQAIFLGLNHSACLSTKNFPMVKPCCIYFSAPWMVLSRNVLSRCPDWGGVRIYDLEKRTFEHAFILGAYRDRSDLSPSEVWITPNI